MDRTLYLILEELFEALDGYTTDEDLLKKNPHYFVSGLELRKIAEKAYHSLLKLSGKNTLTYKAETDAQ
jgi:hypothetical protein